MTQRMTPFLTVGLLPHAEMTMSTDNSEEAPANITTDAESQEYGAQHGQTVEGENTGSSSPDAQADPGNTDAGEAGAGTGAKAGEYS